jgi:hypothetical protein
MKNLEVVSLVKKLIKTNVKPYSNDYVLHCQSAIYFTDNIMLGSWHEYDCCEDHFIDFEHITIDDFKGLNFDLSNDNFFKRIPDYGIELIPINGHSIKIPGYGYNNGWYGTNIKLVIINNDKLLHTYDVTECQKLLD